MHATYITECSRPAPDLITSVVLSGLGVDVRELLFLVVELANSLELRDTISCDGGLCLLLLYVGLGGCDRLGGASAGQGV